MKKNKKHAGFTLIEVVLTIAIGGLIFLIAFIAFRNASANRRDSQRRSDAGKIVAAVQSNYADTRTQPALSVANANICGTPANILDAFMYFTNSYLCKDGEFFSPQGTNYTVIGGNSATVPAKDEVKYSSTKNVFGTPIAGTNCDGSAMSSSGYKVEIGLEKGTVCRDSK